MVQLLDQGHVAEQPRVARVIERSSVGKLEDEAQGTAARVARVHGGNQVHRYVAHLERTADVATHRLLLRQAECVHPFVCGDHQGTACRGDGLGVERVIGMRMRHEYRRGAIAREVLQRVRRCRIPAEKRIDENARSTRRGDLEGGVAEPLDLDRSACGAGLRVQRYRSEKCGSKRKGCDGTGNALQHVDGLRGLCRYGAVMPVHGNRCPSVPRPALGRAAGVTSDVRRAAREASE